MEKIKDKIATLIVNHKIWIISLFAVLTVVSVIAFPLVKVVYNLMDYIPEQAASTMALQCLNQEFTENVPNAEVMITDISPGEAVRYKKEMQKCKGVTKVLWLDDILDLNTPLEVADPNRLEGMYKDRNALILLTIDLESDLGQVLAELHEIIGPKGAIRGQVVEFVAAKEAVEAEITRILILMIPLILVILFISTTSWLSPFLFIFTILLAVLLNMGTNAFLPQVSFITQSVAAALQLAVTIDYMIFLLHAFEGYLMEVQDSKLAMKKALKDSFSSIFASALTTICGFLALIFMRFTLGADLGIVLAKGIFFSLLTVLVLLPAMILLLQPLLEKTRHRSFVPKFKLLPKLSYKLRVPVLILLIVLVIPAFYWQKHTDFQYGAGDFVRDSQPAREQQKITDVYGEIYSTVLMIPRGDLAKERQLVAELKQQDFTKSITGYTTEIGFGLPEEILPQQVRDNLLSKNYSRYFWQLNSPREDARTFEIVAQARAIIDKYYPEKTVQVAGINFSLYDLKETIQQDAIVVNGLAILAVGLVILLTFRKLLLPFILVLTIEFAIWVNLSLPYLTSSKLSYIGYLVISTVQLGATVDYAILLTRYYMNNSQPRAIALRETLHECLPAVIMPALILTATGYILGAVSSIHVVSELGRVLGRGGMFSLASVVFVLPALWYFCDRFIRRS